MPARRLEARTPGRPNSYTLCSGPSAPMRPAGFFHRVIKCQPNRASAATPWTADKSCQGSGLCPRSADCEALHLPPCPGCRVSLGHRFEYVSVSPLNCPFFFFFFFLERAKRKKELGMDWNPAYPARNADISLFLLSPNSGWVLY